MIIVPKPGRPPERSERLHIEGRRLLHVALRDAREGQPALAEALRSMCEEYAELPWNGMQRLDAKLIDKVKAFRPTVIWMQLQRRTDIVPQTIEAIRRITPGCKIINWDGDQHNEPTDPERAWFVELGRAVDCSLVCNTKHPAEYADLGVRNPGYLQIGVDRKLYSPQWLKGDHEPIDVAFLGSYYQTHGARNVLISRLREKYGKRMATYGYGWQPLADGFLHQSEEAGAYMRAKCAISMSIRANLPRYTSDRLFRGLCSGGVMLVQYFPDAEALGMEHGENCMFWQTGAELEELIADVTIWDVTRRSAMRRAAAQLGHARHTWQARKFELDHIIEVIQ